MNILDFEKVLQKGESLIQLVGAGRSSRYVKSSETR